MAATGSHLKIKKMGDNVMGVDLKGNPAKPEPIHFRVSFPGGDVDVARTEEGKNWVHVRVNNPRSSNFDPTSRTGYIEAARGDYADSGPSTPVDVRADLYHLAVKVTSEHEEMDRSEYAIAQRRVDPRCSEDDCHVQASRTRPDGDLTCGNHEGDTDEPITTIENCTLVIAGGKLWVNSPTTCVLRLTLGAAFEQVKAVPSTLGPTFDIRADSGQGVYTPAKS